METKSSLVGVNRFARECVRRRISERLDLVITNALIIDWSGIYKADIASISKNGNPDIMFSVLSSLILGSATEFIAGEKLFITAGAINTHIH
ncbi:hypothetical protein BD410DRAFT_845177 [Rickenella mellea]|uniref:Urease alpha-subunit N-terminal domain-containing protein n=1 Tax=Rickenella mellea TaxID=50990 RepID=A0A4Y7PK16_9AGAM|nr:hypothetical protein BD410DRAFT_845177 [Rickenella mellea]